MPYPYGMYNAPTVGNGLGGLPRRTTTVAAAPAASTKYDVQFLTSVSIPSMPNGTPTAVSVPILMNGRGLQYFANSSPTYYRNTFDYSSAGVTNNISTATAFSSITQLPTINASVVASGNCIWSHNVSSTQTIFKYTKIKPFLVTWDGVTDSSYIYPPNPTDISISINADAFLLPSGNLICIGNSAVSPTQIYIAEYTPAFALVRSMYIGNLTNLGSVGNITASAKRTTYGYIIAVATTDGTRTDCLTVTLNNTCTTVIGTSSSNLTYSTPATNTLISILCGQDGAMFFSTYNSNFAGAISVPVLSTGAISTVASTQYYGGSQSFGTSSSWVLNYIGGAIPSGAGCTKYADSIAPAFYMAGSSNANPSIVLGSQSFSGTSNMVNYVDADIYPTINTYTAINGTNVFSGEINRVVKGSYSYAESSISGSNMAMDENGFIYINYSNNFSASGKFFRRVYRPA